MRFRSIFTQTLDQQHQYLWHRNSHFLGAQNVTYVSQIHSPYPPEIFEDPDSLSQLLAKAIRMVSVKFAFNPEHETCGGQSAWLESWSSTTHYPPY